MCVVDHHLLKKLFYFRQNIQNMELTERELLVQQLNFDWNSSNRSYETYVNSQETRQVDNVNTVCTVKKIMFKIIK